MLIITTTRCRPTIEKRFFQWVCPYSLAIPSSVSTNYDGSYLQTLTARLPMAPTTTIATTCFILTQVYDLPFGHGKQWASNLGRAGRSALSEAGLLIAQPLSGSGLPFTSTHPDSCSSSSDTGPCRADVVGSVKDGPRSGDPGDCRPTGSKLPGGVKLTTPGQTAGPWAPTCCGDLWRRRTQHLPRTEIL